jgi:mannosyl-glycoprotein endo-beta-N-acetylglucosaminidase
MFLKKIFQLVIFTLFFGFVFFNFSNSALALNSSQELWEAKTVQETTIKDATGKLFGNLHSGVTLLVYVPEEDEDKVYISIGKEQYQVNREAIQLINLVDNVENSSLISSNLVDYHVNETTALYENGIVIGSIESNSLITYHRSEEDDESIKYYMHMNGKEVYIQVKKVEHAYSSNPTEPVDETTAGDGSGTESVEEEKILEETINDEYFLTTKQTPIYASPQSNAEVIAYLYSDKTYKIHAVKDDWYEVTVGDKLYYINSADVSASVPEETMKESPAITDNIETIVLEKGTIIHNRNEEVIGIIETSVSIEAMKENDFYIFNFLGDEGKAAVSKETETEMNTSQSKDLTSKETTVSETVESSTAPKVSLRATTSSTQTVDTSKEISISSSDYFKVTSRTALYIKVDSKLVKSGAVDAGQEFKHLSDMGGWYKVVFGDYIGYINKQYTIPSDGSTIQNKSNPNWKKITKFKPNTNIAVYDKSSGKLEQFGSIYDNISFPMVYDIGDWYRIDFLNRIGYVREKDITAEFNTNINYFEPTTRTAVYVKRNDRLERVGAVDSSQEYHRIGDTGGWHQIKFGNEVGYVQKDYTKPAPGYTIKNANTGYTNSGKNFTPTENLAVYDNTSGKLVQFGTIYKGNEYPMISDIGSWFRVDLAGRIGYISDAYAALSFENVNHFKTVEKKPVYSSENAKEIIGYLDKGESFPMLNTSNKYFHKINFSNIIAYVSTPQTEPIQNPIIGNALDGVIDYTGIVKPTVNVAVYDVSSGTSVSFATLLKAKEYKVIGDIGDWIKVDIGSREGFIKNQYVEKIPTKRYVYNNNNYNYTLDEMLDIQMNTSPQTDNDYPAYVRWDALQLDDPDNPTYGIVKESGWRVRGGPSTTCGDDCWIIGELVKGQKVYIKDKVINSKNEVWYEITYNKYWVNASPADTLYYLDPNNFDKTSSAYYQFLDLSKGADVEAQEINSKILYNKGILKNTGKSFIDAGEIFGVNELYLISHALLETGNGTSELAKGVLVTEVNGEKVEPKVVYNMYGIGAFDNCALRCGAETAYKEGWFSVESAIIGGAKFISESYINPDENVRSYQQNTLYKMRWNPDVPGTHQYATDIGWAYKQTFSISKLYGLLESYTLRFEIPLYKTL